MTSERNQEKRGRGRPPKPFPEPIDADPMEIARVVLNTDPPKKWRYLEEEEARKGDKKP